MVIHNCLLCLGSNTNLTICLSEARKALRTAFPGIRFGETIETAALGQGFLSPFSNQLATFTTTLSFESVRATLKELERRSGRTHEDKARGIVKLDIDLLMFDERILKPEDMKREYVRKGLLTF